MRCVNVLLTYLLLETRLYCNCTGSPRTIVKERYPPARSTNVTNNPQLLTNRKSLTRFRMAPKSVTLSDLERRSGRHFALFYRIR